MEENVLIEPSEKEVSEAMANDAEERCDFGLQKQALVPGKTYRGTFWLNEFGEFHCKPEQKGTNPSDVQKVTEGENYKLFTTKNLIRLQISIPRGSKDVIISKLSNAISKATIAIMTYKFN